MAFRRSIGKLVFFIAIFLSFTFQHELGSAAISKSVTINESADVYTNYSDIDALDTGEMKDYLNNQGQGTIKVNYCGSAEFTAMYDNKAALKFPTSPITGNVISAKLKINMVDIVGNPHVNLISTPNDFIEAAYGSTFPIYNASDTIAPYSNYPVVASDRDAEGWYSFDVTNYVNQMTSGASIMTSGSSIITFVITGDGGAAGNNYFNFVNNQESVLIDKYAKLEIVMSDVITKPYVKITAPDRVEVGQVFDAYVSAENMKNIYAEDITLSVQNTSFQILKTEEVSALQNTYYEMTSAGAIRMILASQNEATGIQASEKLFKVTLKALRVSTGKLSIDSALIANQLGVETVPVMDEKNIQIFKIDADVNNDGKVSLGDLALAAFNKNKDKTQWSTIRADVNQSNEVDELDLTIIVEKLLNR